jgi:hypothetical protein
LEPFAFSAKGDDLVCNDHGQTVRERRDTDRYGRIVADIG